MSKKIVIESLAMDLKRIALGLHRNSLGMAKRFKEEALKRESELESFPLDNYLTKLVKSTKRVLSHNSSRTAEDVLMLSVLFQNYAQKKLS